jgi:antitoxin (DNA-binding transcriptional repressor) of toxin-antitoxin stability system
VCSTLCYTEEVAREITQRQLRNESGEIMRALDAGNTFTVTRNGVPVGELTPLRRHRFVSADTVIGLFGGGPGIDLARLRSDLDLVASQGLHPRA